MSRRDMENAAQECASVMTAQRKLKGLAKDEARMIREAHARWLAEREARK